MSQPTPLSNLAEILEWQSLNETRIELFPEHWQKAAQLSQLLPLPQQRWQVYLCALGVVGFEQWLQERAPDLQVRIDNSTIWQPAYANLISAACNITVGKFKICVATASSLGNIQTIPFGVFDIADFIADFYVLMQVEEEQQHVAVAGFMSYEQFCRHQTSINLTVDEDWTYALPTHWFNSDPNALLLNLRCLDKAGVSEKVTDKADTNLLQQKLANIKSQLQTRYPWELLTVEEGKLLLSNSELINWVYQATTPSFVQPIINVGLWLRNQIDTVAQELGWMLMPAPALSSQMRDLQEGFDKIRVGLEAQGVHIPATARGAYRNLDSESGCLRLYAIMWVLSATEENSEWMLLVALGGQPNMQMPRNVKLEVRDERESLFAQSLENTSQAILYAQVIGNCDERFWVTVTANDTAIFEIPPFGLTVESII